MLFERPQVAAGAGWVFDAAGVRDRKLGFARNPTHSIIPHQGRKRTSYVERLHADAP